MRRVLFLSYHFPPIGGAGVQRPTKLVRYLPDFGYEPVVITGPGAASGRWTPEDESLAANVPPGTEVHRVPGPVPPPSRRWRARAERWLRLEPRFDRWWVDGAVAAGRSAGGDIDVICASMAPYSSAEAAARLARELDRPWVADLRDPWALDEVVVYPTALHRRRELTRMRRLLSSADAIVMNTREAASRLRSTFPDLNGKPVVAIPNGFDPADFADQAPPSNDETFRIVHTGYLHTQLGREHRRTARVRRLVGGDPKHVDILTRSHVYLLAAVQELLETEPERASAIEVHLAGVLSQADRAEAEGLPFVRLHGYLPHKRAVEVMRSADLLFLPLHDLPPGIRGTTIPGKTYDYLASGTPILAAVPDGDARDLLVEAGNAFLCRPSDIDSMKTIISAQLGRARCRDPVAPARAEVLDRHAYPRLTAELAATFDSLLGVEGLSTATLGGRTGM